MSSELMVLTPLNGCAGMSSDRRGLSLVVGTSLTLLNRSPSAPLELLVRGVLQRWQ